MHGLSFRGLDAIRWQTDYDRTPFGCHAETNEIRNAARIPALAIRLGHRDRCGRDIEPADSPRSGIHESLRSGILEEFVDCLFFERLKRMKHRLERISDGGRQQLIWSSWFTR